MPTYTIRFAEGNSTKTAHGESFMGRRSQVTLDAGSRAMAYVAAFHHFGALGYDVAVIQRPNTNNPLDFSSGELETIREAGVPIKSGYPTSGVQLDEIVEET